MKKSKRNQTPNSSNGSSMTGSYLGDPSCHHTRAPITRRDFLAKSATAMASTLFLPSITSLLSQVAYGAECSASVAGSSAVPVICLDLAGGGNLAGSNFMVGGVGGQSDFLADYTSLGITTARSPRPGTSDFVAKLSPESQLLFHEDSAFFEGLVNELTPTARAKVDGSVFCTRSADDTNKNPFCGAYYFAKAQLRSGFKGELTTLVGMRSTDSGGNSAIPPNSFDSSMRPVAINRTSDAVALVDVGVLKSWIGGDDPNVSGTKLRARAERILRSINNLSSSQLSQFAATDMPNQVKELVNCGFLNSKSSVNKYLGSDRVAGIDPAQDPNFVSYFALGANANQTPNMKTRSAEVQNKLKATAGIAKLVLEGKAGAGIASFGGYDYHQNDRAITDARDREAGHVVGAIFNAAEKLGKDAMIYIYTDGGLASGSAVNNSTINGQQVPKLMWNSDNGTKGLAVILCYRHKGLPEIRRTQIGHYNASGSVESTVNLISGNVENLTMAVVANYMALSGNEGQFASVVGTANPFGAELDEYLAFTKL